MEKTGRKGFSLERQLVASLLQNGCSDLEQVERLADWRRRANDR
jgi:hypothetical protein